MEQLVDGFINELLDRWLDSWSSFPYDCTVQGEMDLILLIYMFFFTKLVYRTDLIFIDDYGLPAHNLYIFTY